MQRVSAPFGLHHFRPHIFDKRRLLSSLGPCCYRLVFLCANPALHGQWITTEKMFPVIMWLHVYPPPTLAFTTEPTKQVFTIPPPVRSDPLGPVLGLLQLYPACRGAVPHYTPAGLLTKKKKTKKKHTNKNKTQRCGGQRKKKRKVFMIINLSFRSLLATRLFIKEEKKKKKRVATE